MRIVVIIGISWLFEKVAISVIPVYEYVYNQGLYVYG